MAVAAEAIITVTMHTIHIGVGDRPAITQNHGVFPAGSCSSLFLAFSGNARDVEVAGGEDIVHMIPTLMIIMWMVVDQDFGLELAWAPLAPPFSVDGEAGGVAGVAGMDMDDSTVPEAAMEGQGLHEGSEARGDDDSNFKINYCPRAFQLLLASLSKTCLTWLAIYLTQLNPYVALQEPSHAA